METQIFYNTIFVLTAGITKFCKTLLPLPAGNAIKFLFYFYFSSTVTIIHHVSFLICNTHFFIANIYI